MRTKYGERVFAKSFSRTTIDYMFFHAFPSMGRHPDRMVLHTRANIFIAKKDAKIARNIYALAGTLKTEENIVFVSGIVNREDDFINERTVRINKIIAELYKQNQFPFIDNHKINVRTHLN